MSIFGLRIEAEMGSNLFEPDSVMVPRTKSFIVKDRFGGVADLWVGDAFHSWFDEQRVLATGPSLITYCTLACRAFDKEIIEMLRTKGGSPSVSHVSYLLTQWRTSTPSVLFSNGIANIFYVCDASGTMRSLSLYGGRVGWHLEAYMVNDTSELGAGVRIFLQR